MPEHRDSKVLRNRISVSRFPPPKDQRIRKRTSCRGVPLVTLPLGDLDIVFCSYSEETVPVAGVGASRFSVVVGPLGWPPPSIRCR